MSCVWTDKVGCEETDCIMGNRMASIYLDDGWIATTNNLNPVGNLIELHIDSMLNMYGPLTLVVGISVWELASYELEYFLGISNISCSTPSEILEILDYGYGQLNNTEAGTWMKFRKAIGSEEVLLSSFSVDFAVTSDGGVYEATDCIGLFSRIDLYAGDFIPDSVDNVPVGFDYELDVTLETPEFFSPCLTWTI